MGPIALLDCVGLDVYVSRAIGESPWVPVPRLLVEPVESKSIQPEDRRRLLPLHLSLDHTRPGIEARRPHPDARAD
jgi:hypothetical protein